jgi:hypothetical protein
MWATPTTFLLNILSISLSTGREYGRGGRGAKSLRRFGGRRCVPGILVEDGRWKEGGSWASDQAILKLLFN